MTLRESPTNANITLPPITSLFYNSHVEAAENVEWKNHRVRKNLERKEIINSLIRYKNKAESSGAINVNPFNAMAHSILTKVKFPQGQTSPT